MAGPFHDRGVDSGEWERDGGRGSRGSAQLFPGHGDSAGAAAAAVHGGPARTEGAACL